MIILHGVFAQNDFYLWGETPAEPVVPDSPRKGRKQRSDTPRRLPFDAGAATINSRLLETGLECAGLDETRIFIQIPTVAAVPIASSSLIADHPGSTRSISFQVWAVSSLRLQPADAIDLLCRCVDKELLAPGLIVGRDLAFWAVTMRLGAGLVLRQQFLPGLAKSRDAFRATWEPLITGGDHDRLLKLESAMPHVCRAASLEAGSPPQMTAARLLTDFIGFVVDYLAREAASESTPPTRSLQSIHDHWLHALASIDGVMDNDPAELAVLARQISEWRRPISISSSAPFRLCFRLEEPAGDFVLAEQAANRPEVETTNGDWKLQYLLQDLSDPSLLVPAEAAWNRKASTSALFKRRNFNAPEYLLSSLGQAAALSPQIEESLKSPAPAGCDLDSTAAYGFLNEKAWLLEQAGFTILLPSWWTRKGTRLRLSARAVARSPKLKGGSGLSLDQIVHVDWEVCLGGEPVSPAELEMLAKLKSPLVKYRGQWVQLNSEEITEALGYWRKRAAANVSVRDLIKMSLGEATAAGAIPIEGVTAGGWIGDLLNKLGGSDAYEEQPKPKGLQATLRPYQVRGYSWLSFLRTWGLGACLADDMGLGKTVQVLTLIQKEWEAGVRRPVLGICPTSVVGNWQKEAARFTPELPVMVHHGIGRRKGANFRKEAEQHALVISSYSLLYRDLEALKEIQWSGIVLDEAQNVKNSETRQAKAARSLDSEYRLALTGTPVENNVGDLWSIMEFLNPGLLGSLSEFKRRFFLPIQTSGDPAAAKQLRRLTEPFILRRLKTDKTIISDLPEKMEMKVFCTLTREQASLYKAVVDEAEREIEESEGIKRKGVVLATLSKLKQVCNHPAQFLGDNSSIPNRSGKLARLAEMIEEVLESRESALIFTQFREMGEIIRKHLQETFGREVLFLHGGVAKKHRDQMVERFQGEREAPPIFILSLKAGGTGLNLTRANHVFHFDRWWNPAVENQATDRAFRIGQVRNVQVHKYLCAGTLEDKIDEMIERKKGIASSVVGSGEQWLTELSTKELKELFALRQEAVVD